MWKKILLVLLGFSFFIYAVMTVVCFVAPAWLLAFYKIDATPGTLFLGFTVAWFTLLLTLVSGFTALQVRADQRQGWTLSLMLGFWCIAVGIAVYAGYGHVDTIFTDALRGALIVLAAYKSRPTRAS